MSVDDGSNKRENDLNCEKRRWFARGDDERANDGSTTLSFWFSEKLIHGTR